MWVHMIVQLLVIGLFFLLGWAIGFKQQYGMLSGFNNRSEEEQKELIERGYPQKTGSLLIYTAVGMLLLFPLIFTSFPYAIEVQYGFMTIFLLGGYIYLSRFELPEKRKKVFGLDRFLAYWLIGFILGLSYIGYQPNELVVKDDSFEITGMYGNEWSLANIEKVELVNEVPKVNYKENGFGMGNLSKGHFHVDTFGNSLLFIRHRSPYLLIVLKEKAIFINGENGEQTESWYQQLTAKLP